MNALVENVSLKYKPKIKSINSFFFCCLLKVGHKYTHSYGPCLVFKHKWKKNIFLLGFLAEV